MKSRRAGTPITVGRARQISVIIRPVTFNDQFPAAVSWYNLDFRLREGHQLESDDLGFIDQLVQEALACGTTLPTGFRLYRARFNEDTDAEPHPPSEMGMPPAHKTRHQRISPKGVACLYASYEVETALHEMRPCPKSRLTVVTLQATAGLNVLDLRYTHMEGKSPALRQAAYMISRPVDRDDEFRYAATQRLGQGLKAAGAAGLLYASMLKPDGTNVAMFNESSIKRTGSVLYEITGVDYTFKRL